ncbi:MAG: arginine decarboxylase, partial [Verrucomicrobia bacterium]|nr:arginine decarboxylase [Verrucomicrobiota bacterium]
MKQICEESNVELPDIVSESGRALVAPHSILIFEAVDRITRDDGKVDTSKGKTHQLIKELEAIRKNKRKFDPLERYHDAKEKREEAHARFSLGNLRLEERAAADRLFWDICRQIRDDLKDSSDVPDELARLDSMLAEQYVCNFSVFQSLLDHWALD